MKERPSRFLADTEIDHTSETFDYIRELHEYLWRVVRSQYPGASGSLREYLDSAIAKLEEAR